MTPLSAQPMPTTPHRNVEIKAQARDWSVQLRTAQALADAREELVQTDTFFEAADGLLKLREFADGAGELIHYHRPCDPGPKTSHYRRVPVIHAAALRDALSRALGVRGTVRKTRLVLYCGQTRVHFDDVANLGRYIELEVVLRADQRADEGCRIAEDLMTKLAIGERDLIDVPYLELLNIAAEEADCVPARAGVGRVQQ